MLSDVVTIKLPCGTQTFTNNKKVFGRVLAMPKPDRYELQTQYGVVEWLLPTKELERVPVSMGFTVNGPSIKVAISKVALEASTSGRVVVSYKCKRALQHQTLSVF